MASKKPSSSPEPAPVSSHQSVQHSSQHVSRANQRGGDRTGQHSEIGHYNTASSESFQSQFQSQRWQGQETATQQRPDFQTYEGQWNQQWQQREPYYSSGFRPTAQIPQRHPYDPATQQYQHWSQIYPQYGHINPAFFAQQPVGQTQYPTNTLNNSYAGYGGLNSGFEPAHNGRQWSWYSDNYQPNQVSMANSQASATAAAAAAYQPNYLSQNTIYQPQPQYRPTGSYASGYDEGTTGATNATNPAADANANANAKSAQTPAVFRQAERYDPRFSQLECLADPDFMDSRLTTPGDNPRLYLLPQPKPTKPYLERANRPPQRLRDPKKLLIVLDLNGTLLVRSNRGLNYTPRPFVNEFLAYCLEHHRLIVWSSARPHNVQAMVAQLFTKEQQAQLVKIWSREHLRLGAHYNSKVQVYKQLTWLWEDAEVQASFPSVAFKVEDGWKEPLPAKWDQSNTVLLDDSVDKAASEPYNLVRVDEFTQENKRDGEDVLGRVLAYIENLKWEVDVSAAMRQAPFLNGQGAEWDWNKGERKPSA